MNTHISAELNELANLCQTESPTSISDWSVDAWYLDSPSVEQAKLTYRRLLLPQSIEQQMLAHLETDGIQLNDLFLAAGEGDPDNLDRITRADILELVAAASMIAKESLPPETLVMPNVPKRSRRQSDPGIDIMGINLAPSRNGTEIVTGDRLFIGSVKHTISDASDLKSKLIKSVSASDLSKTYLIQQFRVFHGRLLERGIDATCIFEILKREESLDPSFVRIVAVAAMDSTLETAFDTAIQSLFESPPGLRHIRKVVVSSIESLGRGLAE